MKFWTEGAFGKSSRRCTVCVTRLDSIPSRSFRQYTIGTGERRVPYGLAVQLHITSSRCQDLSRNDIVEGKEKRK